MSASAATFAHPRFVSAEVSRRVLTWPDVIARLREAYSVPHGPKSSPPRVVARGDRTWVRALTAVPAGGAYMGAKVFGFGRQKKANYVISLFDQETGNLVGLVDGYVVTAYRTAATSAVAVDRMAAAKPVTVAILGSGLEASMHLEAIAAVRDIAAVQVFSPTAEKRDRFAATYQTQLGRPCRSMASPEAAVLGADVVVAAARSYGEKPILLGSWLRPGMMVVSIGSTLPEQREIDEKTVEVCDFIICDMVEEVTQETGDMIAAAAAGVSFASKVVSLNQLMCKDVDSQAAKAKLPMYKSVGSALQDIVVAGLAFDRAREQDMAPALSAAFLTKG